MKTAARVLAGCVLILLLVLSLQFCVAYLRTPAVVAEARRNMPMPLDAGKLPPQRLEWLLVIDDPNFFRHHGVDFGPSAAGYTTISQALAKRLFFEHFEPGLLRWNKVRQSIIAIALDMRVPKKDQLNLFLNLVYLGAHDGHQVIGLEQGAREYFGRGFSELNDDQYLSLLAAIAAPGRYAPDKQPAANQERAARMRRLLQGQCKRNGITDVELMACAGQTR
jgi:membrane peptidoglycan carboxypeptidase